MFTRYLGVVAILAACTMGIALAQAQPTPIVEFTFEGGSLANTGSAGGAGEFVAVGIGPDAPVIGTGLGLNGGDAMDNRSVDGTSTGGYLQILDDAANLNDALDNLLSFTVTGWLKIDETITDIPLGARFMDKTGYPYPTDPAEGSLSYVLSPDASWQNQMSVNLNRNGNTFATGATYNDPGQWVFFASTYDGTTTTSNLKFFKGTENNPAMHLIGTYSRADGALGANDRPLVVSGLYSETIELVRAYDGLMDNVRVYGSKTDASGALSVSQVDQIFLADNPGIIPDPLPDPTVPIVEFTFDGGSLANTGSAGGTATLVENLGNTPVIAADLGTQGTGDYVLDNRSADGTTTGGYMQILDDETGIDGGLDNLRSFTVTAWVKIDETVTDIPINGRILDKNGYPYPAAQNGSIRYTFGDPSINTRNIPTLSVNSSHPGEAGDTACNDAGEWIFVAAAYDGTSSEDNVRLYKAFNGDEDLTLIGTGTEDMGPLGDNDRPLAIGGLISETLELARPYDGLMDNIRIFGSLYNGDGALTTEQILSVFEQDNGESGALDGDLNSDGFVGGDDLDIVRSFWGQNVTAGDLLQGDPSGDGFVGGDDLDIVRANWGQGTPPSPSAVPEPSTLALLAGSLMLLGACRRRHG